MSRTLREHIEQKARLKLEGSMPIMAWIVQHASTLYRLYHRGHASDGKTPFQRLTGKKWKVALPSMGEVVDFHKRSPKKFDSKWARGIYLGVREMTTEKIVAGVDGTIYVVQSIRRVPLEQRWDKEMIKNVTGVPWNPNPSRGDRLDPMLTRI